MSDENFLDELINEAEEKEEEQTEAYYDLVLMQIKTLSFQIENNFCEAEKECSLINNWALTKNAQINEKIKFLELKLRAFILERGEKTIDLPNGILKMHKRPDKVEVSDLELFLQNAKPELVTVIPETVKPDLNKIKAYIKTRPVPKGITVILGKEEFTYKIRKDGNDAREEEETGVRAEQADSIRTAV